MTAKVIPFRRPEPIPTPARNTESNERCWLLRGQPPALNRY
jgi:hypothetical protein